MNWNNEDAKAYVEEIKRVMGMKDHKGDKE